MHFALGGLHWPDMEQSLYSAALFETPKTKHSTEALANPSDVN